MTARRVQILVGLFLSLGVALLPLGTWGRATGLLGPNASAEISWWIAVVVLILYVLFIERRQLSSVGFRAFGSPAPRLRRNCCFAAIPSKELPNSAAAAG